MSPSRRISTATLVAAALLAPLALPPHLGAVAHARQAAAERVYPESRRVEQVDTYHGTDVLDPYRWLEYDVRESPEVAAWVEAENAVTFAYLESIPQREAIRKRLTELWNYERYGAPSRKGDRYFISKNDGLQNQSVVYVMDRLDGEPRVLFDPNTWSEDGTVALGGTAVSDDGRFAAYGIAEAGSDWRTWRIRDIETGEDLPETLRWIKFSSPAWTQDGRGFFYSRYPEPAGDIEFQALNKFQRLYYHRIGTPQSQDVLVYHRPDKPDWGYGADVSEDGRYLVIGVWKGGNKNRVMVRDLAEPYGMPVDLIDEFVARYDFLGNDGPQLYFSTDHDAPKGRVVRIDLRQGTAAEPVVVLPEAEETLRSVSLVGNLLVASYLKDATSSVRLFDLRGAHVRDVALAGMGTAYGFGGRRTDTETFYTFASFATPPSIFRYDLITGTSSLQWRDQADVDPAEFVTQQVKYVSADGTTVPMFICHRKGLELDGDNPTLLYGYGGFNVSLTPSFSVTRLAWMEMGGVFAMPNLRGGGEYGEAWHQAGTRLRKQNVFDDFIAAAEWLIDNDYTRPERLAIRGGSNGGLLVGACMAQRPELYGACLPAVGVMDMLRFHEFTIGWAWVPDYGSSDDPEEFEALMAYSPYHNLEPGTEYPATLITTADTDDRVVPAHSFKFAAALQYAQSGDEPVLIRIETRAGHGAGKPTAKRIEEAADLWSFLVHNLGMEGGSD